ncbi:hypothetical protein TPR58_17870 [Sphingomonas sp. HF-S3]|uniref:Integral membrane protein n=1 Tax=Sphingomonas rustica TaxID=3103142 RepID=A0ABV0BE39_9SPHN
MKEGGWVLIAVGFLLAFFSFIFDPSVDALAGDRIVNIGRLQTQMLIFASGAVLCLMGTMFVAAGSIVERLPTEGPLLQVEQPSDASTAAASEPDRSAIVADEIVVDRDLGDDRHGVFQMIMGLVAVTIIILGTVALFGS